MAKVQKTSPLRLWFEALAYTLGYPCGDLDTILAHQTGELEVTASRL
jgi:hypothetical protein